MLIGLSFIFFNDGSSSDVDIDTVDVIDDLEEENDDDDDEEDEDDDDGRIVCFL